MSSDPQEAVFAVLTQAMVVPAATKYSERFAKRLELLYIYMVMKKTWFMCLKKVAVGGVRATASSSGFRPQRVSL